MPRRHLSKYPTSIDTFSYISTLLSASGAVIAVSWPPIGAAVGDPAHLISGHKRKGPALGAAPPRTRLSSAWIIRTNEKRRDKRKAPQGKGKLRGSQSRPHNGGKDRRATQCQFTESRSIKPVRYSTLQNQKGANRSRSYRRPFRRYARIKSTRQFRTGFGCSALTHPKTSQWNRDGAAVVYRACEPPNKAFANLLA